MSADRDDTRLIKEKFEVQPLVYNGADIPCNQEIDITLAQIVSQSLVISGREMNYDARIALAQPIDDGRGEACCKKRITSDSDFAGCRIGEKLDVLHCLAQIVKHRRPAVEQGAAVCGWLDTLGSRSSSRTPMVCSNSPIDLETAGCVVLRSAAAFRMLPA